jgi:hypothetical protein
MRAIILTLVTLLVSTTNSYSQGWRMYKPSGKGFSVELPAPLRSVPSFEGEHGVSMERHPEMPEWVAYYAAIQSVPVDRQFGIVVYDIPPKDRKRVTAELLERLRIVIGDDDTSPTSEKEIQINGLSGKEYSYAKDQSLDIYTKGRIFYTGRQIYIIVFRTRSPEDLTSPDAERFLNSFRLRKRLP